MIDLLKEDYRFGDSIKIHERGPFDQLGPAGRKQRVSMVFLAENGEGTDWMSVREYCDAISKKIEKREVYVLKDGVDVVMGRPKEGAKPNPKKKVVKKDKGPDTPQAVYYRVRKGYLEKKIIYGKVVVREKKAK